MYALDSNRVAADAPTFATKDTQLNGPRAASENKLVPGRDSIAQTRAAINLSTTLIAERLPALPAASVRLYLAILSETATWRRGSATIHIKKLCSDAGISHKRFWPSINPLLEAGAIVWTPIPWKWTPGVSKTQPDGIISLPSPSSNSAEDVKYGTTSWDTHSTETRKFINQVLATSEPAEQADTLSVTKPGRNGARVEAAPVEALRLSVAVLQRTWNEQCLAIAAVNITDGLFSHKRSRARAFQWLTEKAGLDYTPARGKSPGIVAISKGYEKVPAPRDSSTAKGYETDPLRDTRKVPIKNQALYQEKIPPTPHKPNPTLTGPIPEKPKRGENNFQQNQNTRSLLTEALAAYGMEPLRSPANKAGWLRKCRKALNDLDESGWTPEDVRLWCSQDLRNQELPNPIRHPAGLLRTKLETAAEFANANKRPSELRAEMLNRQKAQAEAQAAQDAQDAAHEAAVKVEMEHILAQHYNQLNQLPPPELHALVKNLNGRHPVGVAFTDLPEQGQLAVAEMFHRVKTKKEIQALPVEELTVKLRLTGQHEWADWIDENENDQLTAAQLSGLHTSWCTFIHQHGTTQTDQTERRSA